MSPACAAAPRTYHRVADLAYASTPGSEAHRLDLYVPDGPGPYPTLLWIHGGAWLVGDKKQPPVEYLAERGYVVASVRYRFSTEAPFPAQLHDVKAAVRYLRARAPELKIDPARIAAAGDSAGGHLASLLGVTAGVTGLEGNELGNAGEPSAVAAVAPFYGPTDFSQMDRQLAANGCGPESSRHDAPSSPESRLLGCTITASACAARVQAANPIHHIGPGAPPFLIQHGARDCTVPPDQSRTLQRALQSAGAEAELIIVPDRDHGGAPFSPAALNSFLDRVLNHCPSAPRDQRSEPSKTPATAP